MFTKEKLNKVHELSDKIEKARELASELLRTAQDRSKDNEHELERAGKQIKLKESVLWDEVFQLGASCQAGKILTKEHPEVFEAYKNQDIYANELKVFCIKEFNIDYTKMTISNYLKMTEALIDLKMKDIKINPGNITI